LRLGEFPLRVVVVALLCVGAASTACADIVAGSADEVCAPDADPCNVSERIELVTGSVLDFGLRGLVVSGSGKLDFLDRSATVLAGPIVLGGDGVGATAAGAGGVVNVKARSGCAASPQRACLAAKDCDLGLCSASSTCVRDSSVSCATDADCVLGTCSVGAGTIAIDAIVNGKANSAAEVNVTAAGSIVVNAVIDVSATTLLSDGGSVSLESRSGSLTVAAPIKAGGGGDAMGGSVELFADVDIVTAAVVDVSGGDGDGGEITAAAGRDLTVSADINASSASGAGYGGDIELNAGRDLWIDGVSANAVTLLSVIGHKNDELPPSTGDGGDISLYAGRDLSVGRYAALLSRGAAPDGYGGYLDVSAEGALSVAGSVRSNAEGNDGDGGSIALTGGTSLVTTENAGIEADGGAGGDVSVESSGSMTLGGSFKVDGADGGDIAVTSSGPMQLGGSFLLGANVNGGRAGSLSVTSGDDATVTAVVTALKQNGSVELEACRLTLASGAKINNNTLAGANTLYSRERMRVLPGSAITTRTTGRNKLVYRSASKPPLIQGTVLPLPVLELDETMNRCPVCGNGDLDETESCDDGNTADGDACSADCQLETCIAQTTGGYPANPLCFDASDCTVDTCNTKTGNCQHVVDCNDGIGCTVDVCSGTSCTHTPDPAPCSDGIFCNGAEVCEAQTGCVAGTVPDCDDTIDCTIDSCSVAKAACVHTPDPAACSDGVFCNGDEVCSDVTGCVAGSVRDCADAFACTIDVCNEAAAACDHTPDDAACQDADECTTNRCSPTEGCVEHSSGLPGCTTTTTLPPVLCGDVDGNGQIQATDALLALRAAVGSGDCDPAACDINGDASISAGDALAILLVSVGQTIEMNCPPPGPASAIYRVPAQTITTIATTTTTTTGDPAATPADPAAQRRAATGLSGSVTN